MHDTLVSDVKAYIDKVCMIDSTKIYVEGWVLNCSCNTELKVRIKGSKCVSHLLLYTREDVNKFYKLDNSIKCGFKCEYPCIENIKLEIYENEEWIKCLSIDTPFVLIEPEFNEEPSTSFVVVDNFYKNPDEVRKYALRQQFNEHQNYHKGRRTDTLYRFEGLKERFEKLLNRQIKNWDQYGTNGCFQYCIAGDQLVYHFDGQTYAGIIYLTPDAPPNTGTSFYRSRHTKKMKVTNDEHPIVFKNGFLDSTEFDLVDTVGNVYNRLILFDAKFIHSATCYFGNTKENGRLFQLFFFD